MKGIAGKCFLFLFFCAKLAVSSITPALANASRLEVCASEITVNAFTSAPPTTPNCQRAVTNRNVRATFRMYRNMACCIHRVKFTVANTIEGTA